MGNILKIKPATLTMTCDTDLSAKGGFGCVLDTTDFDNVNLAGAAANHAYVIYEGALGAAGAKQECTVAIGGFAEAKLGGTVTINDKLTTDADGKWVVAAAGEAYSCVAWKSGVVNDLIAVLVERGIVPAEEA